MIETSVAHTAPTTEAVVETIEREIARLKAARPYLSSCVERAEHIIVTQLSCSNGSRSVKVRVHADGSRSYAVRSGSKLHRVYTVVAGSFECDCPDARRRSHTTGCAAACKHGIACWLLERAATRRPSVSGGSGSYGTCSGCGERTPHRELTEVRDYHESLTHFEGDMLCVDCFSASDCW